MADKKIVEIVIKTDTSGVTKATDSLKKGIKETKVEADTLNESLGKTSSKSNAFDTLRQGAESLIPSLKGATAAGNGLLLKMWELVANPFGAVVAAVVVAVKFLYEAFQNSVAGGKELKAIFAGLEAVVTQFKDGVFALGRALLKLDWGEAKKGLDEISTAATTTFEAFRQLEKQQQKNDLARRKYAVVQSETNKLLVKSRDILTEETSTLKEKAKALDEVTKAETKSAVEKVRIANEDLRISKSKQKQLGVDSEAGKKMNQEIRELQIAVNEAETENAQTGVKLNRQRKMLHRQEMADYNEKIKKVEELKKIEDDRLEQLAKKFNENLQQEGETQMKAFQDAADKENERFQQEGAAQMAQFDAKEKALEEHNIKMFNSMATYEANITANAKEQADERKVVADIEAKAKNAALQLYAEGLAQIANAIGLHTDAGKAAAIASTTISTYLAAQNAYASQMAIPSPDAPFRAALAAGLAITAGLANVNAIINTKTPMGGGGEGSGVPQPQAPRFNVVGATGVNQLAQAIGQNQEPIKAYVVSSEISSQQSLDRNKVMSASLG
jgi:hypothetical protein